MWVLLQPQTEKKKKRIVAKNWCGGTPFNLEAVLRSLKDDRRGLGERLAHASAGLRV